MAYSDALWKEAKKKCRLNNEDIKIAKELGLNPKSLMKNIPSKNEQWKIYADMPLLQQLMSYSTDYYRE